MESLPVKLLGHYLHLDQDMLQLWLSILLIDSLRYAIIGTWSSQLPIPIRKESFAVESSK